MPTMNLAQCLAPHRIAKGDPTSPRKERGGVTQPCEDSGLLKHRDVFQQRNDTEDDDDDSTDLLGASVERQQIDQVQNENDDQKRDECTDKHSYPPESR
jgi:hypothetical protein